MKTHKCRLTLGGRPERDYLQAMRYLIVLFGLVVGSVNASADDVLSYVQSSGLLRACQGDSDVADAYVAGFMDSHHLIESVVLKPRSITSSVCIPDQIGVEVIKSAACSYAMRHTEMQDLPASVIISSALQEAFPCR